MKPRSGTGWREFLGISVDDMGTLSSTDPAVQRMLSWLKVRHSAKCIALFTFCRFVALNPDGLLRMEKEWIGQRALEFAEQHYKDSSYGIAFFRGEITPFFESNGYELPVFLQGTKRYFRTTVSGRRWASTIPSIQRWLTYLQTRKSNSEATKRTYLGWLFEFCVFTGMGPEELVLKDKRWLQNKVEEFGNTKMEKPKGWARSVNNAMSVIKGFFSCNGFRAEDGLELVISPLREPDERRLQEYIPTLAEVLRMARVCGVGSRDYCAILLLGFSGLRNSALRALRVGDIRTELESGISNLLLHIREGLNDVVPGSCKGGRGYKTFTTKMTTEGLRDYLGRREREQGGITDGEFLLPTRYTGIVDPKVRSRTPMTARELQERVQWIARSAGLPEWKSVHPHCFRKFYESWMRNQPLESRMDPKEVEALMGHRLPGVQRAYFRPSDEELRAKVSRLLVEPDESSLTVRLIARKLGINPEFARQLLGNQLGRQPTPAEEIQHLMDLISSTRTADTVGPVKSELYGPSIPSGVAECPRHCGCHVNPPAFVIQCPVCGCFHSPGTTPPASPLPKPPSPPGFPSGIALPS